MLMICYDPTALPEDPPVNRQPEHHKLEIELRERGVYVSGAGLWPVEAAKRVHNTNGKATVTDGPFAETKEAVGGYYIVDCDESEAVKIAGRIPLEPRSWVEVRPVGLFHPNVARISQMRD
jgi:hypothetical protein